MLALVDGKPQIINLKEALKLYVEFRQVVITRRSKFELKAAKERAHTELAQAQQSLARSSRAASAYRRSRPRLSSISNCAAWRASSARRSSMNMPKF